MTYLLNNASQCSEAETFFFFVLPSQQVKSHLEACKFEEVGKEEIFRAGPASVADCVEIDLYLDGFHSKARIIVPSLQSCCENCR